MVCSHMGKFQFNYKRLNSMFTCKSQSLGLILKNLIDNNHFFRKISDLLFSKYIKVNSNKYNEINENLTKNRFGLICIF